MAKGASIKFQSHEESVPKLLGLLNLQSELKKHDSIILKPCLSPEEDVASTNINFTEAVLRFCIQHKNPVSSVFIAEGADGVDTMELFKELGYQKLAEKYGIGLIDLNTAETEEIENENFHRFDVINYPSVLKNSFIISIPTLSEHYESDFTGALSNMIGAFPAKHYKGLFSSTKNKIRKHPMKYSYHDIVQCKMPNFAVIDASEQGLILAGLPLEIDKQAAKLLDIDWKTVPHLRLIDETIFEEIPSEKDSVDELLEK